MDSRDSGSKRFSVDEDAELADQFYGADSRNPNIKSGDDVEGEIEEVGLRVT